MSKNESAELLESLEIFRAKLEQMCRPVFMRQATEQERVFIENAFSYLSAIQDMVLRSN